jgi:hypothetical protein
MFLALPTATLAAGEISSSALINQALDSQVADLTVQGGLLDVMRNIEQQTGVHIEATPAVWDALPWGQDTTVRVHASNTTIRQALDGITQHLGLTYRLGSEAVILEPSPPLARLGRRATLQEVQTLDLLAATPLPNAASAWTVGGLLQAVDRRLAILRPGIAVDHRGLENRELAEPLDVPRNATLMDALERIPESTDVTWYPWGRNLVVVRKIEAIRLLLTKRLTRRYVGADLQQVLLELSEFSNVPFMYQPGVLQHVPPAYQRVTLTIEDATVQQTLENISAKTGLRFTPTDDGVSVSDR